MLYCSRFKLYNVWSDSADVAEHTDELQQMFAEADVIFTGEEGCGWGIEKRLDDEHIQIYIQTSPEVMGMLKQDPRLELIEDLIPAPVVEEPVEEEI